MRYNEQSLTEYKVDRMLYDEQIERIEGRLDALRRAAIERIEGRSDALRRAKIERIEGRSDALN